MVWRYILPLQLQLTFTGLHGSISQKSHWYQNLKSSIINDLLCGIIVAYLLHARTVEPQKQMFLSNTRMQQWNNGVMQPTSRQWLGKHTSAQAQ
jgi:hypothetical protein